MLDARKKVNFRSFRKVLFSPQSLEYPIFVSCYWIRSNKQAKQKKRTTKI